MINLPWPPAVNNLYATVGRKRIRTERYKAWLTEAGWMVRQQRPSAVLGRYRLTLVAYRPDARKHDLDGILKAPLDLLVSLGITEDDSLCQSIHATWSDLPPAKPGSVSVSVVAA